MHRHFALRADTRLCWSHSNTLYVVFTFHLIWVAVYLVLLHVISFH